MYSLNSISLYRKPHTNYWRPSPCSSLE